MGILRNFAGWFARKPNSKKPNAIAMTDAQKKTTNSLFGHVGAGNPMPNLALNSRPAEQKNSRQAPAFERKPLLKDRPARSTQEFLKINCGRIEAAESALKERGKLSDSERQAVELARQILKQQLMQCLQKQKGQEKLFGQFWTRQTIF